MFFQIITHLMLNQKVQNLDFQIIYLEYLFEQRSLLFQAVRKFKEVKLDFISESFDY